MTWKLRQLVTITALAAMAELVILAAVILH